MLYHTRMIWISQMPHWLYYTSIVYSSTYIYTGEIKNREGAMSEILKTTVRSSGYFNVLKIENDI